MKCNDAEQMTRDELLRTLREEFEIKSQKVSIGADEFEFWSLRDPEAMLDAATLEASHEELPWQPYWAQLWDASIGLCHELSDRDLNGCRILDLGCGLGATGAVAASRGARVVAADNAPPALKFVQLNCWPWRERVSIQLLDWNCDQLAQRFDIILGADIIYDRTDIESLNRFWRNHLQADGIVLLSEPTRAMTGNLMKAVADCGWGWIETSRKIQGIRPEIRFFELRLDSIEQAN